MEHFSCAPAWSEREQLGFNFFLFTVGFLIPLCIIITASLAVMVQLRKVGHNNKKINVPDLTRRSIYGLWLYDSDCLLTDWLLNHFWLTTDWLLTDCLKIWARKMKREHFVTNRHTDQCCHELFKLFDYSNSWDRIVVFGIRIRSFSAFRILFELFE